VRNHKEERVPGDAPIVSFRAFFDIWALGFEPHQPPFPIYLAKRITYDHFLAFVTPVDLLK